MWAILAELNDQERYTIANLLGWMVLAAVLIWCISFAIRSANKRTPQRVEYEEPPPRPSPSPRYIDPIGSHAPIINPEPIDGPGRFVIAGVDKDSGFDVTEYINAASAANAKVKAELKGVVVTSVRRDGN